LAKTSYVLVSVESFAGRRTVPFGGTIAMPRLAELVGKGVTYDDAVATTTLARPSAVSLLTGVSPDRSGVRDNIHDALGPKLPTLGDIAKAGGFETAAFVASPFVSYSSGLPRGFELFDGPDMLAIGPSQHAPRIVPAASVAGHFKEWLGARDAQKPYFAWIHFSDLNALAIPVPSSTDRTKAANERDPLEPYDKTLGKLDTGIGAVLDALKGAGAPVTLILVGTHGVLLGEGDRFGEGFWLARETLRVPLVVVPRADAAEGTARHEGRPTWLPDVAATVARALGGSLDAASDGVPLETTPPSERVRLAWGFATDDQLGWKPQTAVIESGDPVVFEGSTAVLGTASPRGSGAVAARPATPRVRVLPEPQRDALKKAGITLGAASAAVRPPAKPQAWLKQLQLVRLYLAADRPLLARRQIKEMFEVDPHALAPLLAQAYLFSTASREGSGPVKRDLLARYPDRSDALHWAAHLALTAKKNDEAQALLEAALGVGPVEPEMHYDLACVRALLGDKPGALEALDQALVAGYRNWDWIDKDPDLATVRSDPGFVAIVQHHGR
jgi:hypothetical protein